MRVLHLVKTSDGARWAALQAAELARLGIEVHVALPSAKGNVVNDWEDAKAVIHEISLDYPARKPWSLPAVCSRARSLVASVKPDIIHAHNFGPVLLIRRALGLQHLTPRIFQVPGPLHLEHWPYRTWDKASAGAKDFWIASSRCIQEHYLRAGIERSRVFLSYYGFKTSSFSPQRSNALRRLLRIPDTTFVAGNISYIYTPKYCLGQRIGLKCHEDLIAALGLVINRRPDVIGVLAGGAWGKGKAYEHKLRRLAEETGRGRILMPGHLPFSEVQKVWPDFDCAIHAPLSENCGGVVEPLLAGVPTIAARVGGLPEVVINGRTGLLVPRRDPSALHEAILRVIENSEPYRQMADRGSQLVQMMFDVRRTAREVHDIYSHILDPSRQRPLEFNAADFLDGCRAHRYVGA